MIAFSADIYSAAGVQAAVDAFADFARFEWSGAPEDGYFKVGFTPDDDVDPAELEGEFSNFALARSIEGRGA